MLGSAVGPYEIVDKLGSGGMGEVFLGHDPRLQRRVALKRLTAAASGAPDDNARVLREARAVARLNHPNIAAVYDVLQQDGRTFIVMEYVEGESLSARMARERMPIDHVRLIGRQLASALALAILPADNPTRHFGASSAPRTSSASRSPGGSASSDRCAACSARRRTRPTGSRPSKATSSRSSKRSSTRSAARSIALARFRAR